MSSSASAHSRPARVAIVGGGCAGLSAAFELSRPELSGRYEVTVYQLGWRLGGKGASGRGVGGRIEEHGLHVWMGFYENAFRLMRQCYGELGRDRSRCPIADFSDAFTPAPYVAVTERLPNGAWDAWIARFPPAPGLPGDPLDASNPFTIRSYLTKAAALVAELLRSASNGADTAPHGGTRSERVVDGVEWLLRHGQLAGAAALVEAMELLVTGLGMMPDPLRAATGPLLSLCEAVSSAARRQLAMLVDGDGALRRTFIVVELVLAVIRGSLVHGLLLNPQGFDALDAYDWRAWLKLHGAGEEALDSGFLRAIYDLAFAYVDGDPARPSLSAAAAMRGAMRMFFTYRGSLFWRMNAGMGDVVFAPLYEVLRKRGVRFSFFHRLRDVELSPEDDPSPHVAALHFDVQAATRGAYQPLIDVKGLPCWPSRPNYAQLIDGAQIEAEAWELESPWEERIAGQRSLQVGEDFDFVVLALGGAAVPLVTRSLIARSEKWQRMERGLHCVATQAFQLWMTEDMESLGFPHPPVNLSGWVEPFDTWADMRHLIPAEASRADVRAVAYFCSPYPDNGRGARHAHDDFHHAQQQRVHDDAIAFLQREVGALWPGAMRDGSFRWDMLAVEPGVEAGHGPARFDTQFWTANVRPTDRYALSLPGTAADRLSPLDRSFDNLTVAGDWTETGLNTGCVESAVIGGQLAAHAISGSPALEDVIGYDHP